MSETIHLELSIAAAPHSVFLALAEADELTHWFAEQADLSQTEGRYDFWGRLTPGAPTLQEGHHRLLTWEVDHSLGFLWSVRGAETTVTITLEPEERATRLRLVHEGLPVRRQGEASFTDFWELSLENLRGWVERRVVGARCNFSGTRYGDVEVALEITAPRAAVFHTLMAPEELNRYFASKAAVEPYVGGRYNFGWGEGGPVKILELAEESKLVYSWRYDPEPPTVVTWTLENSGGGTRLTLVHAGFGPQTRTEDYHCGWLNCLNQIKFLVETGPTWQKPRVTMPDRSAV